jgi:hypothetical protein
VEGTVNVWFAAAKALIDKNKLVRHVFNTIFFIGSSFCIPSQIFVNGYYK